MRVPADEQLRLMDEPEGVEAMFRDDRQIRDAVRALLSSVRLERP